MRNHSGSGDAQSQAGGVQLPRTQRGSRGRLRGGTSSGGPRKESPHICSGETGRGRVAERRDTVAGEGGQLWGGPRLPSCVVKPPPRQSSELSRRFMEEGAGRIRRHNEGDQ